VLEDQKIVVGRTTTMQGNHEQRNQQANLPLFNIKMTTKRKWDNYQFTSQ
jgi:hypothetical protein